MNPFVKAVLFSIIIATAFPVITVAQPGTLSKLKERIYQLKQQQGYLNDTAYANAVNQLAFIYADNYPDSAIALLEGQAARCKSIGFRQGEADVYKVLGNAYQTKGNFEKSLDYYNQSYQLAEKINYQKALPGIQNNIGLIYMNKGNYSIALRNLYQALKTAEANKDQFVVGLIVNNIANIHFFQGKMNEAETDYRKMLNIAEEMSDTIGIILAYNNIGEVNLEQDSALKALTNLNKANSLALRINNPEMLVASTKTLGYVYFKLDSIPKAKACFETAISLSKQQGNLTVNCKALIGLATVQNKEGLLKEALANALEGLQMAEKMGQTQLLRDANEIVATIYENLQEGNKAITHYRKFKIYSDSIHNFESERAALTEKADYEFSKKELEFQRKNLQQRWLIFSSLAALFSICLIAWLINRNRRRLNHANKVLQHKNLLIEAEKLKAEETLVKLQAAQSQLIQAEKMASLGELTAGIAHEIQNPLNFVTNFSEVSNELIDELQVERLKAEGERDKELENDLLGDIKQNLEKINHHGKRADAIVKGMLQHSRTTTGKKEPTDINALADEYIRLCYHGLRAKDKSFNAAIKTDFDPSIGKIDIIPQDIGRVMLNLLTNAFYAVAEKKKQQPDGYEPSVTVKTSLVPRWKAGRDGVLITVTDNGNGIPEKILNKIFQPFFTTKPTGEGTGLGLSLSYDIITKGHGGEFNVETKEGKGASFIIELPVN